MIGVYLVGKVVHLCVCVYVCVSGICVVHVCVCVRYMCGASMCVCQVYVCCIYVCACMCVCQVYVWCIYVCASMCVCQVYVCVLGIVCVCEVGDVVHWHTRQVMYPHPSSTSILTSICIDE